MTHAITAAALAVALLASTAANAAPDSVHNPSGAGHFGAPHFDSPSPAFHNPQPSGFNGQHSDGFHDQHGFGGPHTQRGHGHGFYPSPFFIYPAIPAPIDGLTRYCADPQGYYPAVLYCNVPWQEFPPE